MSNSKSSVVEQMRKELNEERKRLKKAWNDLDDAGIGDRVREECNQWARELEAKSE